MTSSQQTTKTSFQVHTFGCKVNTYDSGLIQARIQKDLGWRAIAGNSMAGNPVVANSMVANSENPESVGGRPQVHILNTCAVTAEASKEAVRQARRIKSKNPFALVVATGCAAQVDSSLLADSPAIDLVVANSHKMSLPFLIDQFQKGSKSQKLFKSNIFRKSDTEPGGGIELGHTRSFLKIQDGCNSFCSFCIIPYARGTSRSLSILDLVDRIRSLEALGTQEVVLTGVHIGDYRDPVTGLGLEDLLEQILRRTNLPRIRLTSLEPIEVSERLLDLFQNARVMPHFHMSIQAANDQVLRLMKRQYGQKEVLRALERISLRVPGAFVGMDVIAGFPSETEEQFQDTYQALRSSPWSKLHVFPYSERSGTKALLLEAVPREVRHRRAKILRELSQQRLSSVLFRQPGTIKRGLELKNSAEAYQEALSEDYFSLRVLPSSDFELSATPLDPGAIREFRVVAVHEGQESLYVEPL